MSSPPCAPAASSVACEACSNAVDVNGARGEGRGHHGVGDVPGVDELQLCLVRRGLGDCPRERRLGVVRSVDADHDPPSRCRFERVRHPDDRYGTCGVVKAVLASGPEHQSGEGAASSRPDDEERSTGRQVDETGTGQVAQHTSGNPFGTICSQDLEQVAVELLLRVVFARDRVEATIEQAAAHRREGCCDGPPAPVCFGAGPVQGLRGSVRSVHSDDDLVHARISRRVSTRAATPVAKASTASQLVHP